MVLPVLSTLKVDYLNVGVSVYVWYKSVVNVGISVFEERGNVLFNDTLNTF